MEALTGSKRIATALTWLVLVIFCALIATGWWYLLAPTLGQQHLAGLIAILLTILAALCARQIGHYRADAITKGARPAWHHGWKPYLFLAIISALGTLNAAFVLFESRSILRGDIAMVRGHYSSLRDRAHQTLPPKGYEKKVAEIEGLLKGLHEEIVSPVGGNYCGVGREAFKIIAQIRTLIPDYHVLNGSGAIVPCDIPKAERLYQSYADMAHAMILGDREFLGVDGPAKVGFLAKLDQHYAAMDQALGELEGSAIGVGGTEMLNTPVLYEARNNYNADRRTFLSLDGRKHDDIREIKGLQSDDVNSYAATVELFWKRLFEPSTWFYLVLAFAIDFVTIYLLTQLNVRFGHVAADDDAPSEEALRFETDPRFLWTNPKREVFER